MVLPLVEKQASPIPRCSRVVCCCWLARCCLTCSSDTGYPAHESPSDAAVVTQQAELIKTQWPKALRFFGTPGSSPARVHCVCWLVVGASVWLFCRGANGSGDSNSGALSPPTTNQTRKINSVCGHALHRPHIRIDLLKLNHWAHFFLGRPDVCANYFHK